MECTVLLLFHLSSAVNDKVAAARRRDNQSNKPTRLRDRALPRLSSSHCAEAIDNAQKRLTLERRSNRQSYRCYEKKYPCQTRRLVLGCSYCLICPPSNPASGSRCGAG